MRKLSVIFTSILFVTAFSINATAENKKENIFFGKSENQIGLYLFQGTGGSKLLNLVDPFIWEYVPFNYVMLQYSQPVEVLRLASRFSVQFGYTIGWGHEDGEDWRDYTWPIFGASWDISFFDWHGFYIGAGVGPSMKWKVDSRQDSRFMFNTKVFIGYRIDEKFSMELVTMHYSDGNLTPVNGAYNFAGLSFLVNF